MIGRMAVNISGRTDLSNNLRICRPIWFCPVVPSFRLIGDVDVSGAMMEAPPSLEGWLEETVGVILEAAGGLEATAPMLGGGATLETPALQAMGGLETPVPSVAGGLEYLLEPGELAGRVSVTVPQIAAHALQELEYETAGDVSANLPSMEGHIDTGLAGPFPLRLSHAQQGRLSNDENRLWGPSLGPPVP